MTKRKDITKLLSMTVAVIGLGFLACSEATWANTCVPLKPVKISGALCGRVFDLSGKAVPNAGLRVVNEADVVVAEIQANSKGDFCFPPLPKGKQRLATTSPGWQSYVGEIEVTNSKATICKKRLSVYLGLASCQGGISTREPPRD